VIVKRRRARANPAERSLQLEAALAEYDSLRQESMASISNRITVVNFTFGALAVMIAGLLAQSDPTLLSGAVAVLFVPQLAKTGLLIWLGEYDRSQRAGRWIRDLESRINSLVDNRSMLWESTLMAKGTHMSYPYASTVLLLLGAGWASLVVGFSIIYGNLAANDPRWLNWVAVLGVIIVIVAEVLFALYFRAKWRAVRLHYSARNVHRWAEEQAS
jgi:biotin transporter BioY